ncbi:MAG: helix-turn-helix transcriptional regulator [Aequorivita sp.]|nr:helix-turn-helix transcriptional regulator [Aequorivita sp.]
MVCDRCKSVLQNSFENAGMAIEKIELGEITFKDDRSFHFEKANEILINNGFEFIHDENELLIEKVKSRILKILDEQTELRVNLSEYLSKSLNKEYSILSKLFSTQQGLTIEKYFIRLKIEKAKEYIQMNNMSFSEIAYNLNYKSSSHLANQFKSVTGIAMGEYKKLPFKRNSLDKIV